MGRLGPVLAATLCLLALVAVAVLGRSGHGTPRTASRATAARAPVPAAPRPAPAPVQLGAVTSASHRRTDRRATVRVRRRARPARAPLPPASAGLTTHVSAGAPSDAEIRRELSQMMGVTGGGAVSDRQLENSALLQPDGTASPPPGAPAVVQQVIHAANQVARAPYVFGGGHGHWVDTAYDCSGSVSFALAGAGLLDSQLDSTSFEHWGSPGPGRWITIYANAQHAFMVVAGLRYDTSGRQSSHGSRWQGAQRTVTGFVARHPTGL